MSENQTTFEQTSNQNSTEFIDEVKFLNILTDGFDNIPEYILGFLKYNNKNSKLANAYKESIIDTGQYILNEIVLKYNLSDKTTNSSEIIANLVQLVGYEYLQKSKLVPIIKLSCDGNINSTTKEFHSFIHDIIADKNILININYFASEICAQLNIIKNNYDRNICVLNEAQTILENSLKLVYDTKLLYTHINNMDQCLSQLTTYYYYLYDATPATSPIDDSYLDGDGTTIEMTTNNTPKKEDTPTMDSSNNINEYLLESEEEETPNGDLSEEENSIITTEEIPNNDLPGELGNTTNATEEILA